MKGPVASNKFLLVKWRWLTGVDFVTNDANPNVGVELEDI